MARLLRGNEHPSLNFISVIQSKSLNLYLKILLFSYTIYMMNSLQRMGTDYGGWVIDKVMHLNQESIVYSGGVGEDISFDLLLSHEYNPWIVLIDPTKRAIDHFECLRDHYTAGQHNLPEIVSNEYKSIIQSTNPHFDKFIYEPVGLWSENKLLMFYEPINKAHVSHTFIPDMYDKSGMVDVPACTIKSLMMKHGHTHIDLLKIDIEGSEIEVINNMLDDNIFPTYLCIEFDLFLKRKDPHNLTKTCIERILQNGYTLVHNENMNITFKRG
jgi:FkbM family methyltransferase